MNTSLVLSKLSSGELEKIDKLFEASKLNKWSKNTRKTYLYSLWDFCKYVAIKRSINLDETNKNKESNRLMIDLLDQNHLDTKVLITEYINDLLDKGQSTSTISAKFSAIKDWFKLMKENLSHREDISIVDLSSIKIPKIEKKKVFGPKPEEFHKILATINDLFDKGDYIDKRNCLIFYVEIFCGLRISEVLGINVEDLSLKEGVVYVHRKGKREKIEVPLPSKTKEKIEIFLKLDGRKKGPLFVNKDKGHEESRLTRQSAFRVLKELTGYSPHKYRHFYADEVYELSGFNKDIAMKFTGHVSGDVFERYLEHRQNHAGNLANQLEEKWLKKND